MTASNQVGISYNASSDHAYDQPTMITGLTLCKSATDSGGVAAIAYHQYDFGFGSSVLEEQLIVRDIVIRPEPTNAVTSVGWKAGISIKGGWNSVIDNVVIHGAAMVMDYGIKLAEDSLDVNIANFRIAAVDKGIWIVDRCEGTLISKGWIIGATNGVYCDTRLQDNYAISSVTATNPAVITTSTPHGFSTGNTVTISGNVGSTPDINGSHVITVISSTSFSIPVAVTVAGSGGVAIRETNKPWLVVRDTHVAFGGTNAWGIFVNNHPQCSLTDNNIQGSGSGSKGIYVTGNGGTAGFTTITNNKIHSYGGLDGIVVDNAATCVVADNVVDCGIWLASNCSDTIVTGNRVNGDLASSAARILDSGTGNKTGVSAANDLNLIT